MMAYRAISVMGAALLAVSAFANLAAADTLPASWAKTTTNDPASNSYLSTAMKPLANPDAETLRVIKLANVLVEFCNGAKLNTNVDKEYKRKTGYSNISGKTFEDAAFLADKSFNFFDYRKLAHLCAGSDYLFGPKGHLVAGLVQGSSGTPKLPYDPNNPYIRLEPLLSAAPTFPEAWAKTMTNDPASNYYLAKAMTPLASRNAELLRVFKLSTVVAKFCDGAKLNIKVGNAYMRKAGYSKIKGKAFDDAAFLADKSFNFFDYRWLAHLCAGGDYMFGKKGHLVKGLISGNKGVPKMPYDPNKGYLPLEPLKR